MEVGSKNQRTTRPSINGSARTVTMELPRIERVDFIKLFYCLFVALTIGGNTEAAQDPSLKLWIGVGPSMTNGGYFFQDESGNGHTAQGVTNAAITYSGNYVPQIVTNADGTTAFNFTTHGTNEYFQLYHTSPFYGGGYNGYVMGDYISVTNLTSIEYLTNATFCFWVKFTTSPNTASTILSGGTPGSDASWTVSRFQSSNGSMELSVFDSAAGVTHFANFGTRELTNIWAHYALAIDLSNTSTVVGYFDGMPFITNAISRTYLHTTQADSQGIPRWLGIGADSHGGTWQIDGATVDIYPNNGWSAAQLRDIRIYTRTLSSSEVLNVASNTFVMASSATFGPGTLNISGTLKLSQ